MPKNNVPLDNYSAVELYEMVLSGKIKRFPAYFWKNEFSLDYAKEIGLHVFCKHFGNDDEKIFDEYGNSFINKVKLHSVLKLFDGKAYDYVNFLFPSKFNPWQFTSCPNSFWNEETGKNATRWLIETRLHWNNDEVKQWLDYKVFCDHKLSGMLSIVYSDSVFVALNAAFPNQYVPWELKHVPLNFWKTEDNVLAALQWLFDEKLRWTENEVRDKLTIEVLSKYRLSGILRWHKGIPYGVLEKMYPSIDWSAVKESKIRYRQ